MAAEPALNSINYKINISTSRTELREQSLILPTKSITHFNMRLTIFAGLIALAMAIPNPQGMPSLGKPSER